MAKRTTDTLRFTCSPTFALASLNILTKHYGTSQDLVEDPTIKDHETPRTTRTKTKMVKITRLNQF